MEPGEGEGAEGQGGREPGLLRTRRGRSREARAWLPAGPCRPKWPLGSEARGILGLREPPGFYYKFSRLLPP